jgi:hypothetical protein
VRSSVWVETTLPLTENTPVPGSPKPLTLLKASVAKPSPSYLKSNTSACLPGASASGPSQDRRRTNSATARRFSPETATRQ